MCFDSNYKSDIPRFIEEKLETISKKNTMQTDNYYIYSPTKPIKCIEKNYYKDTNTKDRYYNNEYNKDLKSINVIFFDTETNGLSSNSSVLSISAAKCKKVDIIERYERFYYPIEEYNPEAISVNNLYQSVIAEKRKGVRYKRYFKEDQESFKKFIDGIDYFVAHNIEFDRKFLSK